MNSKKRGLKVRLSLLVGSLVLLLLCQTYFLKGQNIKEYRVKVEEEFVHDVTGYTQGLFFHKGELYESTGQYGESSFRKIDLKSGKVLQRVNFANKYFVEGSCVIDGRLYILTWMENVCFVYDINTLKELGQIYYQGEGWGLTSDGKNLIMSDGTPTIKWRDPMNFTVVKELKVTLNDQPLYNVNELEYIDGEIWANIYGTDYIVIINPQNGKVTARIDCRNLLPQRHITAKTDVLNGIAYDPENGYIYITGKYWPRLYRVSIVKK